MLLIQIFAVAANEEWMVNNMRLIEQLRWWAKECDRTNFGCQARSLLIEAAEALEKAPTIDALPVIRCQNCKHFAEFRAEAKKDGADGTCRRLLMKVVENDFSSVRATDFCSYGERKE